MKTILSIQSQVAGARVGNSVAAFAMERLGVRVLQLPTTILGRRPDRGAPGGGPMPKELLASILSGLDADGLLGQIDAVLSGYLGEAGQTEIVLDAVDRVKSQNKDAIFVCDPVLGDSGKLFVSDAIADAVLNGLAPQADWLTPNVFEMGLIASRPLDSIEAARDAARRLGRPTLVTSVPNDGQIGVLYSSPTGDWFCETPLLPGAPKGAGDLWTGLYVARRVLGEAPAVALEGATGSVYDVIVQTLALEQSDLALPEAQELLVHPRTWPQARQLP